MYIKKKKGAEIYKFVKVSFSGRVHQTNRLAQRYKEEPERPNHVSMYCT